MQDCWTEIISFLSFEELLSVSSVNKRFSKISRNEKLWERLCKKDFEFLPKVLNITWRKLYEIQYVTMKFILTRSTIFNCKEFKDKMDEMEIYPCSMIHDESEKIKEGDLVIDIHGRYKKIFNGKDLDEFKEPEVIKKFPIRYWRYLYYNNVDVSYNISFDLSAYLKELIMNEEIYVPKLEKSFPINIDEDHNDLSNTFYFSNKFYIRTSFVYNYFTYFIFVGAYSFEGREKKPRLSLHFIVGVSRASYMKGIFTEMEFKTSNGWSEKDMERYEDRSLFC